MATRDSFAASGACLRDRPAAAMAKTGVLMRNSRRFMMGSPRIIVHFALAVAVVALAGAAVSAPNPDRRSWRDYGGSPDNSHFIPSKQINKTNIGQLAVAWNYPYGETGFNPVVVRGVVYGKGRDNSLVALDAATGKALWIHDQLTGLTRRGVNYWESKDGKDRRLILSVADYLQEIDAATGKSIPSFGADGVVDLREGLGRDPATIGRIQSNTPGKMPAMYEA